MDKKKRKRLDFSAEREISPEFLGRWVLGQTVAEIAGWTATIGTKVGCLLPKSLMYGKIEKVISEESKERLVEAIIMH